MKHYCTILLLLVFLVGGAPYIAGALPLTDSLSVDKLEKKILADLHEKKGKTTDSVPYETMQAIGASERLGYTHGKAVALACQAIDMNMRANDFIRAERPAGAGRHPSR